MKSLNIAVVGGSAEERQKTASALAKKSAPQDITMYHTVFGGKIINVVEPTSYPEKPLSLAYALNLADYVVLLSQPDQFFGETLLALSMLRKTKGCTIGNDVSPYLKEAGIAYEHFDSFDEAKTQILSFEPSHPEAQFKAWVDRAFDVKGVGSIALGYVVSGKMHVHDKLPVFPEEKQLEIRSIQKNDVDVGEAEAGDRFGIKFKGIEANEIGRGSVLGEAKVVHQIETTVSVPKYLKAPPSRNLHAVAGLQDVPCIADKDLAPGKENECVLEFHKPLALNKDTITLFDLNSKTLRIAGVANGVG